MEERLVAHDWRDRQTCEECGYMMHRQFALPAAPQGNFGTPKRTSVGGAKARNTYRAERYMEERLTGKRDSELGAQKRALGFEPRDVSEVLPEGTRNPDFE